MGPDVAETLKTFAHEALGVRGGRASALLVAAALLVPSSAGCIQLSPLQEPPPASGAEPVPDPSTSMMEANPGPWQTVALSTTGAAGDWLFFYQPFLEPTGAVAYDYEISVTAEGDGSNPTALLTSEPMLLGRTLHAFGPALAPPEWYMQDEPRGPLFLDRAGGDITFDRIVVEAGGAGMGWLGFGFVVASTGPWAANVRISVNGAEGGSVVPAFVVRGEGTTLFGDYIRPLSVTDDGLVLGEIQLDVSLATEGWNHFQYEYDSLQPDGVRSYEISFPDGSSQRDLGTMHGGYIPIDLPGPRRQVGNYGLSNWYDYCSVSADDAGNFTSRMTYVQAQTRLEAALIHLPFEPGVSALLEAIRFCDNNSPYQPLRVVGP